MPRKRDEYLNELHKNIDVCWETLLDKGFDRVVAFDIITNALRDALRKPYIK